MGFTTQYSAGVVTDDGMIVTATPTARSLGALSQDVPFGTTHVDQWLVGGNYDRGYANLAAIQVDFPWVDSLTNEIDFATIQQGIYWSRDTRKTFLIEGGGYRLHKTLDIPEGVKIVGEGGEVEDRSQGTTLNFQNATGFAMLAQGSMSGTRKPFVMEDITLDGNANQTGLCGVGIANGQRYTRFKNVTLANFRTGAGLLLANTWGATFVACRFVLNKHGVAVQDGAEYTGLWGESDVTTGTRHANGIDFVGCYNSQNTHAGYWVATPGCLNWSILGGVCEGNGAVAEGAGENHGQYLIGPFVHNFNVSGVYHEWGYGSDNGERLIMFHDHATEPATASYASVSFNQCWMDSLSCSSPWIHRESINSHPNMKLTQCFMKAESYDKAANNYRWTTWAVDPDENDRVIIEKHRPTLATNEAAALAASVMEGEIYINDSSALATRGYAAPPP